MCGLFGAIGNITAEEVKVLQRLALFNVLRGADSTGLAIIDASNEVAVYKKAVPSYDFLEMSQVSKLLGVYGKKCIIGHTRSATVGAKTVTNAHPFEFNSIVGAHNGTIDRFCISQYLAKDEPSFGTDSEALYNKLDQEDFETVIPKLEGAWALTAWDKTNKTLMILRNERRPLHCLHNKSKSVLLWSSELEMLQLAVINAGYEFEEDPLSFSPNIMHFETNSLYSIGLDAAIHIEKKNLKSEKVYVSATYQNNTLPTPYRYTTNTLSTLPNSTNKPAYKANTNDLSVSSPNSQLGKIHTNQIASMIGPIIDTESNLVLHKSHDNKLFDEEDFKQYYQTTCQLCGGDIEFNVGMAILKEDPYKPICHSCVDSEPEILQLFDIA
jgi:predicted glutamine amidotransferase